MKTQLTKLLEHLRDVGSISPLEARAVYGIERLASRISELRQRGHNIVVVHKRDREGKRYAEYRYTQKATCLPAQQFVTSSAAI